MSARASLDKKTTMVLETAQRAQETLSKAELNIVDSQKQFDIRTTTTDESIKLPLAFGEGGGLVDPASISLDLTAQLVGSLHSVILLVLTCALVSVGVLPKAQVPVPGAEGKGLIHQDYCKRRCTEHLRGGQRGSA